MYDPKQSPRAPLSAFDSSPRWVTTTRGPAALLGTATAFPKRWCTQQEILDRFSYRDDPVARKMFLRNGMEGRFMSLPPEEFHKTTQPGFQQGVFQRASVDLAEASVRKLLAEHGVGPERIGALVTITSYGFIVPSISAHLVDRLRLRSDIAKIDLTGSGCLGSISLMQTAQGLVQAGRGDLVVAVSSEVGSLFMRDWPVEDKGSMVINALMGDASVAVLLGHNGSAAHSPRPCLVDTEYASELDSLDAVDIRVGADGTMSGHIHREVPAVAQRLYPQAARALLDRHGLELGDIRHWAIHPGSRVVIEAVQDSLGLSDADLATSREVLRTYGNVCSATALLCLHEQLARGSMQRGEYGILGGVGPGMTVGLTLFQYG